MIKIITRISLIALLGLMFIITSCDQKQAKLPDWLEGQWETGDSVGFTAESWEIINDQFMTGEGLFISSEDKMVIEVLNIFIRDNMLFYAAMLPNQNNGEEILFVDTHNNADSLVFENPLHDFPKKIIYSRKDHNSIEVSIYGDEEDRVNTFDLKRIKE